MQPAALMKTMQVNKVYNLRLFHCIMLWVRMAVSFVFFCIFAFFGRGNIHNFIDNNVVIRIVWPPIYTAELDWNEMNEWNRAWGQIAPRHIKIHIWINKIIFFAAEEVYLNECGGFPMEWIGNWDAMKPLETGRRHTLTTGIWAYAAYHNTASA